MHIFGAGRRHRQAKSTDPVKVAFAMENLTVKSFSGDVTIRAADHQLQQPLYIATWKKISGQKKYPWNAEGTGITLVPLTRCSPYVSSADLMPDGSGPPDLPEPRQARGQRWAPLFRASRRPWTMGFHQSSTGISYGLLLFMLSSGLTLIFSMMGVLNFAHTSFYMVGAYFAYTLTGWWASGRRCWSGAAGRGAAGCAVRAHGPCARCTSSAMSRAAGHLRPVYVLSSWCS